MVVYSCALLIEVLGETLSWSIESVIDACYGNLRHSQELFIVVLIECALVEVSVRQGNRGQEWVSESKILRTSAQSRCLITRNLKVSRVEVGALQALVAKIDGDLLGEGEHGELE